MMQLPATVEVADGLSVDGASPELLERLLPEFEMELHRAGVAVDECFAPPIGRSTVAAAFERLALPLPEEVVTWFGWHDGVVSSTCMKAFPKFEFYSLENVVDRYLNERGWPKGHEDWQWNPEWIQLLGDNNGLAIECLVPSDVSPRVRPLTHDGGWGTQPDNGYAQVVSLCTPVTWWIESLRAGEYTWYPEQRAWDWDFGKPSDRPEKRAYI